MFCTPQKTTLKPERLSLVLVIVNTIILRCRACKHQTRMLRPEVAKEMVMDDPSPPEKRSELPSTAETFVRSDERSPSLVLSMSAMALGEKVFSIGRFRVTKHFNKLTKVVDFNNIFGLTFFTLRTSCSLPKLRMMP